jgi:hypothetical protein
MEEPIYMPSARPMSPIASYQPGHFPHEDYYFQYATIDRPQKYNKKKKNKDKGGDASFNSGIYKRRGHLNERAFSYSIRQEDRSRSYGSLANIPFAANGDMMPSPGSKEAAIKEREMLQMVQDLDLSGEILSHVSQFRKTEDPYPSNTAIGLSLHFLQNKAFLRDFLIATFSYRLWSFPIYVPPYP